ncbi:hypothetical protein ANANG_G00167970 [Anguilla anguilla]|uniref:DRBM domain-containing protein n=1 Tax=Anguilla anguilla TaxID=7936 RepID=A0A9D3M483_ANGAN|nr:hypothetical protein ANANG_G00167970 [Anguilla anguilla]
MRKCRRKCPSRPTDCSSASGSAPQTPHAPPNEPALLPPEAGKVSMWSSLVGPFRHFSPGEDEDSLSTSSTEVKENRDFGNIDDRAVIPNCHRHRRQSPWRWDAPGAGLPVRRGSGPWRRRGPAAAAAGRGHGAQEVLVARGAEERGGAAERAAPGPAVRGGVPDGPRARPVFAVRVELHGLAFLGEGPTKKQAKMRAAELALRSFVQFPNASQAHLALGAPGGPPPDFTSDREGFPNALQGVRAPVAGQRRPRLRPAAEEPPQPLPSVAAGDRPATPWS